MQRKQEEIGTMNVVTINVTGFTQAVDLTSNIRITANSQKAK